MVTEHMMIVSWVKLSLTLGDKHTQGALFDIINYFMQIKIEGNESQFTVYKIVLVSYLH